MPEDRIGQVLLESYKLTRRLGEGGMGVVYEAQHLRLPKKVAVKVLHSQASEDPELFERFRREAEVASSLGHSHICEVTDFSPPDAPFTFIVMEHLEGEDLGAYLRSHGPLPFDQAVRIAGEVLSALDAAHSKGIVHRDLKPQNIYLCQRERRSDFVKLLDFGISKITRKSKTITQPLTVLGTPSYMSPEQVQGKVNLIDARTDIWAMGAVLYEMLTGVVAFPADDLVSLVYRIVFSRVKSVEALRPETPRALGAVVARAMSKRAEERFATAQEMEELLARSLEVSGVWGQPEDTTPEVDIPAMVGAGELADGVDNGDPIELAVAAAVMAEGVENIAVTATEPMALEEAAPPAAQAADPGEAAAPAGDASSAAADAPAEPAREVPDEPEAPPRLEDPAPPTVGASTVRRLIRTESRWAAGLRLVIVGVSAGAAVAVLTPLVRWAMEGSRPPAVAAPAAADGAVGEAATRLPTVPPLQREPSEAPRRVAEARVFGPARPASGAAPAADAAPARVATAPSRASTEAGGTRASPRTKRATVKAGGSPGEPKSKRATAKAKRAPSPTLKRTAAKKTRATRAPRRGGRTARKARGATKAIPVKAAVGTGGAHKTGRRSPKHRLLEELK